MTWVCNTVTAIETQQHLDIVQEGIRVNREKNPKNNPAFFYRHHHPLDRSSLVQGRHEMVRRGLRVIRNMDSKGKLQTENLAFALSYYGFTIDALIKSPPLSTHFLRQVAVYGLVR
jgi:hypothetical protein